MTPFQRLYQCAYNPGWECISAIYLDAVDTIIGDRRPGYNPKKEHAAAKAIWDKVGRHVDLEEVQVQTVVAIVSQCCRDYVKAKSEIGVALDGDTHVWPFATGQYPTLGKLDMFWEEAWSITTKMAPKEAATRAAIEGREKFATKAAEARARDKALVGAVNPDADAVERMRQERVLGEFDRLHPDLGVQIRQYLGAMYPGSMAWNGPRSIIVHFERATGPEQWSVPTIAQARALRLQRTSAKRVKKSSAGTGVETNSAEPTQGVTG